MSTQNSQPETIDWASLREIVDALPHAAAVLSTGGDIHYENLAFRSLRFQANPAITLQNVFATLDRSDQQTVAKLAHSDRPGHNSGLQIEWTLPGGSNTEYVGRITRLNHSGGQSGFLFQLMSDGALQDPRLRYLMENLVQGVWDYDLRTRRFSASQAWHQLRGLPPDHDIDMTNENWLDKVHPDDRDALRSALSDQTTGDTDSMVVQYRHVHKAGHWIWILCRASVVERTPDGRPLRIIGTDTDISEAMESQEAINQLAGKLKLAVEASGMGIWEFNPDTKQVHWDDRMLDIYGITDGENVRSGNLWEAYLHPDDYEDTVAYAETCKEKNEDFKRDYRIVQPGGRVRHIRSMARTVQTPGAGSKLIGVNIDVTDDYQRTQELENARAKLEHDALHDDLTGLGNRRALDQCALALFKGMAATDRYAVMQIDLDHFKDVNDTLGHSAGDYILTEVGRMLRDCVGNLGRAFRVGGDEFSILFETAPDTNAINALCELLIETLSAPMKFEGQPCSVGASIGYSIGAGPPLAHSAVFIEADTALYAAKRAGRFTYRAYNEAIGRAFHVSSNARSDLRDAIRAEQIVCHLQPQYDADTLQMVGAEALVRWNCPKRGTLSPAEFLPSATDAGLLDAVDRCVFERVARLQSEWAKLGLAYPRVSVNVSRARLEDENFLSQTRDLLEDHHRFAIELLETTFYDTPSSGTIFTLDALREAQIRIEIDDFGTGHASIKALQALRPDAVKIDRSLVAPLGTRTAQVDILKNLSSIARLEGAEVVLEGLETGAQVAAIRHIDCDVLQGYVLHRPMTERDFTTLLHDLSVRDGLSRTAS